jgi:hypothetical protein
MKGPRSLYLARVRLHYRELSRLLAITKTTQRISDGKAGATGQMRGLKNEAPELPFSLLLG